VTFTGMLDQLTLADALGIAGALFCIVTYWVRTMVLLRIGGIISNALFAAYGFLAHAYPALVLYALLVPLNCLRLYQMTSLVRQVRRASEGELSMVWLKPFMSRRRCRAGETLFRKGERGEEMFYTLSGRYRIPELGIAIAPGQLVGELAFISPGHARTQSLECLEDGQVLTITYTKVTELYFQNPTFGFYFLRLAGERLLQNNARLEAELATLRRSGALAAQPG
jgi:CRP-like cAMP-binding protein